MIAIVTHYRFAPQQLIALPEIQTELQQRTMQASLKGTILLAAEGINLTLSGTPAALEAFWRDMHEVSSTDAWQALWNLPATTEPTWSTAESMPFRKLVVDIRPEIVTFREPELADVTGGQHIAPAEWDTLLSQDNTITLDVRNDFEVALGSFTGAINPQTNTFTEFKAYVTENLATLQQAGQVAMFCTGGIRCEKASAYLKSQGIAQVYQLQGGILNYLKTTPPTQSQWHGECFVFDERVTLDHTLHPTGHYRLEKNRVVPTK